MIKGNPDAGDPSIEDQVMANNKPAPGGKMKPWNGETTFGS
jgi:hypothetical protein